MPSILFICTANRFRSPLAAHYFARELVRRGDDQAFQVSSAGTWTDPDQPAMPKAVQLGKNYDLDLNDHRSTGVSEDILEDADLILVMETGHKEAMAHEFPGSAERVFLLTEVVDALPVNIPDPYGMQRADAEEVAKEIINLVDQGYERILTLAWMLMEKRAH